MPCGQKSGKPRSHTEFPPPPLLPEEYRDEISRNGHQTDLLGNKPHENKLSEHFDGEVDVVVAETLVL